MVSNFIKKKNSGTGVFLQVFFLRRLLCRACPNGCLSDMNQKSCIHKIYLQENTGDGVLFSAVADMCTWSFPKWTTSLMIFQENCEVSQNINFTEQCCSTALDFL